MAKLVLSSGGTIVHQCFLDEERVSIGREASNHVVIDDPAVAKKHAAIFQVGNDHVLSDLDSEHGTFVNGMRVDRHILQHGDIVEFGAFNLRYHEPAGVRRIRYGSNDAHHRSARKRWLQ